MGEARRLWAARCQLGVTVAEMAKRARMAVERWHRVEQGQTRPRQGELERMWSALDDIYEARERAAIEWEGRA